MTSETKHFIETHINQIENNVESAYFDCPLRILNDFNNSMHIAGVEYPPEIHVYVVVCCYIAARFTGSILSVYDFDRTKKETYEFVSDNCIYSVAKLNHDLSVLLPKRSINTNITQQQDFRGITNLKIRVEVN